MQYISSTLTDLAVHARTNFDNFDAMAFEQEELARIGMPREAHPMHRFTGFRHLFSDVAYAAGYYLHVGCRGDNDAFEAFEEVGNAFDPEPPSGLHDYIYPLAARLRSADAHTVPFAGATPVEAMLRKRVGRDGVTSQGRRNCSPGGQP